MKNVIKDSLFMLIFFFLFYVCSNIFILKGNGYGSDVISFYDLKKNSLDLIFFGSSHSYATFSPNVIEKETGLRSYNFATQQQPVYISYYYIKEALKTQKPKYIVLETNMFKIEDDYMSEGVTRDALDRMHMSVNKINAIQTSVEDRELRKSYYFNLIKYHSRYADLTTNDFNSAFYLKGIENQGFIALDQRQDVWIDNSKYENISDTKKITEKNLYYLNKIIQLTQEYDIELILVKSPCQLDENAVLRFNWMKSYAVNQGIDYLDFNQNIILLELERGDFYDSGHLSKTGAKKASIYFSKYLNEKLKDHD